MILLGFFPTETQLSHTSNKLLTEQKKQHFSLRHLNYLENML